MISDELQKTNQNIKYYYLLKSPLTLQNQ